MSHPFVTDSATILVLVFSGVLSGFWISTAPSTKKSLPHRRALFRCSDGNGLGAAVGTSTLTVDVLSNRHQLVPMCTAAQSQGRGHYHRQWHHSRALGRQCNLALYWKRTYNAANDWYYATRLRGNW